jgi:hypothetical protein
MARPGQLSDALAGLSGQSPATVRQVARDLRDAGYMAKERGGRGLGRVTAREAANFTVAVLVSHSPRGGTRVVERVGQFISTQRRWQLPFMPIPELRSLPRNHTFIDAVTCLVEAGVSGSLERALDDSPDGEVEVTVSGPIPHALIEFRVARTNEDGERDVEVAETRAYNSLIPIGTGNLAGVLIATHEEIEPDFSYRYAFTHRTIVEIAKLLRGT